MDFRESLLQDLYHYFSFDAEKAAGTPAVYHSSGGGSPGFLLNRVRHKQQEHYTLSGSLLLSLIDFGVDHTTSVFIDLHSQFFSYESPDQHPESSSHKHDYFELLYVLDGQLDLMIEDSRHRLLPDDACIINSNTTHLELRTTNYTALYLGITPEYFRSFPVSPQEKVTTQNLYDFFLRNRSWSHQVDYLNFTPLETFSDSMHQAKLHDLLKTLLQELLSHEIGYEELCRVYLYRFFALLQNPANYICSNTRFQMAGSDALFERTLSYLGMHKRKLSRRELEQALSYNGNYISRVFQKHTGQTLAEYNRDICMGEAARLLLNTEMPILDICHQIGYENKTIFYGSFQKKYGMTPGQYREKAGMAVLSEPGAI